MEDQQQLQEPEALHRDPTGSPPEYSSDAREFSVRRHHSPCSACGCAGAFHSRKRSSPSASRPAKKLVLDDPCLYRSASDPDPFRSPILDLSAASPPSGSVSNRSLPPWPPTLRRAASDPIPPLPPPLAASKPLSRTSSSASGETHKSTPNSKTSDVLSHWRQINLWMEDIMRNEHAESENPTTPTTEDHNNENDNNDDDNDDKERCAAEMEESLSVEREGERLHIHFKCHCGKGYHFLLSDGNCFYKLM